MGLDLLQQLEGASAVALRCQGAHREGAADHVGRIRRLGGHVSVGDHVGGHVGRIRRLLLQLLVQPDHIGVLPFVEARGDRLMVSLGTRRPEPAVPLSPLPPAPPTHTREQ